MYEDGKLIRKHIRPENSDEQIVYYENSDDNNVVTKFEVGGNVVTSHSKTDSFGRKIFDELQFGKGVVSRNFTYHVGEVTDEHKDNDKVKSSATTQLVKDITFPDGSTLTYEYDNEERITSVVHKYKDGDNEVVNTTEYTYDALGQLKTELFDGELYGYEYDNYGNITACGLLDQDGNIIESNKDTYVYDQTWKDKLISYCGNAINYDAQGNPLNFYSNVLTWEKGRQLKTFGACEYKYNANGIRTYRKDWSGGEHFYLLDGSKILKETCGNNTIIPVYDNEESVCGIIYNNTPYYFYKNLQGDVIAITDQNGDVVARYSYDAWGYPTVVEDTSANNIAIKNPFLYRGYYFDSDTELYYLQSRYYDPIMHRFINGDELLYLGAANTPIGYNLFTYCENSPINCDDTTGNVVTPANVIGAAIGAVIGVVGGIFLGNWLADILNLSGWKRGIFIGGVSALVGAASAVIGYFIGPYVAKIAMKLGQYVAKLVSKGKIVFKKLSSSVKSSMRTLFEQTCCFVSGTQISTPTGKKAIEEITVGDNVYAANPETGEIGVKKVSKVFVRQTHTLYHIVTTNEEVVTTDEHPFWVKGKGWISARNLCQGDILCLQNKETVKIIKVFVQKSDNPVTVYNFEVDDWHTYFVGADEILVHNKCSLTKIKDSYLKQKGFDAHTIKKELVGKSNISKYDMYYDKDSGLIFLLRKGAKAAEAIATGYFIK